MTLFKHSCFLCCLTPSFGVSTTSPKNSSSFHVSPTSAIIFIRSWNRHHMKNNIRYKGNVNNTSVIIFYSKVDSKNSQRWYLLRRTSRFLWFCLLLFLTSLEVFHFMAFQRHPSPFRELLPIFTPVLYFQPSSSQSDSWHFHFNFSRLFIFTMSAMVLSESFLPMDVFYPILLRFVTQTRAGTPHPESSCACPRKVVPSGWCMAFNYWCLNYKTIDLSVAPVSQKV